MCENHAAFSVPCLNRNSSHYRFNPGPYAISRRLATASWSDVMNCAKANNGNLTSIRSVVVGNSQSEEKMPVMMPDGDFFYGIYEASDY
jgi:hypothetical protein